jgi:hypothetical protein
VCRENIPPLRGLLDSTKRWKAQESDQHLRMRFFRFAFFLRHQAFSTSLDPGLEGLDGQTYRSFFASNIRLQVDFNLSSFLHGDNGRLRNQIFTCRSTSPNLHGHNDRLRIQTFKCSLTSPYQAYLHGDNGRLLFTSHHQQTPATQSAKLQRYKVSYRNTLSWSFFFPQHQQLDQELLLLSSLPLPRSP